LSSASAEPLFPIPSLQSTQTKAVIWLPVLD
jgi:hypothetical protein